MSTFEAEHSNERILPNGGMALAGAILEQGIYHEIKYNTLKLKS